MKDFSLDDVAEHLHKTHSQIPKKVLRKITKDAFSTIVKCIETGRHRVVIRQADIMHIYKDYDRQEMNAELMDLDETKPLTLSQRKALKKFKFRN